MVLKGVAQQDWDRPSGGFHGCGDFWFTWSFGRTFEATDFTNKLFRIGMAWNQPLKPIKKGLEATKVYCTVCVEQYPAANPRQKQVLHGDFTIENPGYTVSFMGWMGIFQVAQVLNCCEKIIIHWWSLHFFPIMVLHGHLTMKKRGFNRMFHPILQFQTHNSW